MERWARRPARRAPDRVRAVARQPAGRPGRAAAVGLRAARLW